MKKRCLIISMILTVVMGSFTTYIPVNASDLTITTDENGDQTSREGNDGEATEVGTYNAGMGTIFNYNGNNTNTSTNTKPGITKPGTTKPGITKPGTTKPGTTKPGVIFNYSYHHENGYTGRGDSSNNTDISSDVMSEGDVLNAEYFDDDYFYQLNTKVYVPEVYKLAEFNRLMNNSINYSYDNTVDTSHIAEAYVAPVMLNGTSYMNIYDYTYVYSNDSLTASFMSLMENDISIRNQIMTSSEYTDLVEVYNEYVNSTVYDVNPYVYHYIVEYIDLMYGDKLFDYDFYCETYPMLAVLFNYDEDALKQHFYSIGMFEGRQGIATFNVDNYTSDNDDFGTYYIEYAMSDSTDTYEKTSSGVYQIRLYDVGFENYVLNVADDAESATFIEDLANPYIQGELNALASDRVRYQLGDYIAYGHDLCNDFFQNYNNGLKATGIPNSKFVGLSENIYVAGISYLTDMNDYDSQKLNDTMTMWRTCDAHYSAAINDVNIYVGQSHIYGDYNPNAGTSNNTGVAAKSNKFFYTGCTLMFHLNGSTVLKSYYDSK